MRRTLMLLTVALVMAAMVVVSAMPAFAAPTRNRNLVAPECETGTAIATYGTRNVNPGAENRSARALRNLDTQYEKCYEAGEEE
jgi:hypothetical protein